LVKKWYPFKFNDSFQRWANKIGISAEQLKKYEYGRIDEIRRKVLPPTVRKPEMKRRKVTAKNPLLIVGNGPSGTKNLEKIQAFRGKIGVVDSNFNRLLDYGIVPDYIFTLEVMVRPHFFDREYLTANKDKMFLVCSSITHLSVERQAIAVGVPYERYIHPEEVRCSNVGLFGIHYAREKLKCDKIFLLGFEHEGDMYDPREYERWQYDFWYHIQKWPKETIVNCSDDGKLYYEDYVIDSTLDSLVII